MFIVAYKAFLFVAFLLYMAGISLMHSINIFLPYKTIEKYKTFIYSCTEANIEEPRHKGENGKG